MSGGQVVGVYRWLVRLYPRAFRDDYGTDLVDLFAEQVRDEPAWRVGARALVDLALTVPTQHLEAHMDRTLDRSPNVVVTYSLGAVVAAAIAVGLVVGHPAVFLACGAVALAAAGLAVVNARRTRPLSDPQPLAAHWWKPVAAGTTLLATLIAVTTATGELPSGAWFVAMLVGLASLLLIGVGLVLAISRLANRAVRRPAT
jgi:hypothetical protein